MKKPTYATKAKIRQMIEAGRECGLDVCRYAVSPDGTIHIMEERAQPQILTDFDRLEAIL